MTRVLHITTSTGGGAGRAAVTLHESLLGLGCDSALLCLDNGAARDGVAVVDAAAAPGAHDRALAERWERIAGRLVGGNRTSISNTLFSIGYPGYDLAALDLVREADILHLHWTPRLLSVRGVADLLALGKSVFWTQHDWWSTTPGCHYPAAARDVADTGDGNEHLLNETRLSELLLEDKKRSFAAGDLRIVVFTETAAEQWRRGSIFADRPILVCPNGVDLDVFRPLDPNARRQARRALGVSDDTTLVLLLSQDLREKRKGFAHAAEALADLSAWPGLEARRDAGRLALLTIGARGAAEMFPGLAVHALGPIADDTRLAAAIGLADVMVAPSREEGFSLAILEALACGAPVIAPPNGGMTDALIRDGENGLVASGRILSVALAAALDRFCADDFPREAAREAARRSVEALGPLDVARRMLALYGLEPTAGASGRPPFLPVRRVPARFDPRPSEWLAGQPLDADIGALLTGAAAPHPAAPKPAPHPAAPRPAPPEPSVPAPAVAATAGLAAPATPAPAAASPARLRMITLPPMLMLCEGATLSADGVVTIDRRAPGHAFFGPGLDLPTGPAEIEVRLSIAPSVAARARGRSITLECVYDRDTYLMQRTFAAPVLNETTVIVRETLRIDNAMRSDEDRGLQLRLWTAGGVRCRLLSATLSYLG